MKIPRNEALALAREADEVWVSKGKRLLRFTALDSDEAIATVIIGRSGNLRAPAIRVGHVFLVGFHEDGYTEIFG